MNLTLQQQETLLKLRPEVEVKVKEVNERAEVTMFAFYPHTNNFGVTALISGSIYFGKGTSINKMVSNLADSIITQEFVVDRIHL